MARLIAFHRIFGRHTGEKLGQLCIDLLDRAGVTANVSIEVLFIPLYFLDILIQSGHWTLDNLTTNDKMLEHLEKLFEEREIFSFDAKDNRIMCFPHIINITVQHVLKKMSSAKVPENDDDPEVSTGKRNTDEGRRFGQSFEAACAQDPIASLRKIVMAIRSSGQRRDTFMRWIETGNQSGLFVSNNNPVQIQPKQLLRDVRTRWDSTYQMIKRCIEMRLASLPLFHDFFELTICFRQLTPFSCDQEAISRIWHCRRKNGKYCKSSLTS